MPDLTLTEAVQRTGLARADLAAALKAGRVPGARKMPGGAWAIPPQALEALNRIDPVLETEDGADRDNATTRGPLVGVEPTSTLTQLVDLARRVERATADLSTSRPARAAADAVWRHVQAAGRHEADRDGTCRHCGWQYPCPDRTDAAAAVLDAARVILDGGAS